MNKKLLTTLALIPIVALLLVTPVSAGINWADVILLNSFLQNSDSYDIVWDGPSRGDRLWFTASKNAPSAISNIDVNNLGNVDFLSYERYDSRDLTGSSPYSSYRSSSYNYPRTSSYSPYNRYGSGGSFSKNTYERLVVDNTASNLAGHSVEETGILAASNVEKTRLLANRDVEISRLETTDSITETLARYDVEKTRVLAEHDLAKTYYQVYNPYLAHWNQGY